MTVNPYKDVLFSSDQDPSNNFLVVNYVDANHWVNAVTENYPFR